MKREWLSVGMLLLLSLPGLHAAGIDADAAFRSKCLLCHTTKTVTPREKEKLLGPPVDEVMLHVKEKYPIKEDAVKFMTDYILHPTVEKALCASMDKFGLMPSMRSSVDPAEAEAIVSMMFDRFPRAAYISGARKSRKTIGFATLDADGDGYISPKEFRNFRAKRNGIDPKTFKADLYFRKIDRDGDGRISPEEFEAMRTTKINGH